MLSALKVNGQLEYILPKIDSVRSRTAAIDITNDQDRRHRCVNAKNQTGPQVLHLFVCILHALGLFT